MTAFILILVTMQVMSAYAGPCGCSISNFKMSQCPKFKSTISGGCSPPTLTDDCGSVKAECWTNSTLGEVKSMELSINGKMNFMPVDFTDKKACQEAPKKDQQFAEMLEGVNNMCRDFKNSKFTAELPLGETERSLMKSAVGHHKYTVKCTNGNGDAKNQMCLELEADFQCGGKKRGGLF